MSFRLSIIVRFPSQNIVDAYKFLLARESRPEFEDDVPFQWRYLFKTIENIDYPDAIGQYNNILTTHWWKQKTITLKATTKALRLTSSK